MSIETVSAANSLRGEVDIPGDKSVSHRALILGALADSGVTKITGLLESEDVISTRNVLQKLGVRIESCGSITKVHGVGFQGLKAPAEPLNCGNSGTTMRVLMGVLASCPFEVKLIGDDSLSRRPMKRVSIPLTQMGAQITLRDGGFAPVLMQGGKLSAIQYHLPVASAQIKTAILMAAMRAKGITVLTGQISSRDHTERMLAHSGVVVDSCQTEIRLFGGQKISPMNITVPSDPSTAAFWIGAASIIEGAHVKMKNVLLNSTRIGFINVLKRMGANILINIVETSPEAIGDVEIRFSELKGTTVEPEEIPFLVDEIPLLAVVATQARGETRVSGAEELRVKESDRLDCLGVNLQKMGAKIELLNDGFILHGKQKLIGCVLDSFHDHRIAMAFSIAGLISEGATTIEHSECVSISYPSFYQDLHKLTS